MRYPALRFIVAVHYVLAVLLALAVFGLLQIPKLEVPTPIAVVLALLAPTGLVAIAEVLRLLLSIEEGVRALRPEAPIPTMLVGQATPVGTPRPPPST